MIPLIKPYLASLTGENSVVLPTSPVPAYRAHMLSIRQGVSRGVSTLEYIQSINQSYRAHMLSIRQGVPRSVSTLEYIQSINQIYSLQK